ncbi:MAG: ABC transporter permease, partial [Lachnoanaerobaculum sp.]|nr:ABC transporter permease [Lachnoanaerobaculum sp.]
MREIKKDKFAIISLIILGVLFLTIFIGAFLTNQEEIMKISL